jgi:hypothetical protein
MLPSPILADPPTATLFSLVGDDNIRAALICWGMVLSAFIILRIPREVLLGCLIVAGATVGLAATVVDLVPEQAIASPRASEAVAAWGHAGWPLRGTAANPAERGRPH